MSEPRCRVCLSPLAHPDSIRLELCAACEQRLSGNPKLALALVKALRAVLLFHAAGPWDDAKRMEWGNLTGFLLHDATTKSLCDHIRKALAKAEGRAP